MENKRKAHGVLGVVLYIALSLFVLFDLSNSYYVAKLNGDNEN